MMWRFDFNAKYILFFVLRLNASKALNLEIGISAYYISLICPKAIPRKYVARMCIYNESSYLYMYAHIRTYVHTNY